VEDWAERFGSYLNSGVYKVKQDAGSNINNAARARGLEFAQVDLSGVKGKTAFLKKTAASLGFPGYFGMNWDAFSECLTDMSWRPAAGYVILLDNYGLFTRKTPADARMARRIFDSSAQYWKQRKVPFFVILSEKPS
jgi:hypothetical protein